MIAVIGMAHVSSGASHHFGGGGHYKAFDKSIFNLVIDQINSKVKI